ncbi:MAG: hypothetical protein K2X75_08745 [Burkholderiaceae bacterium]|nr:hypothetical protein [Burkholderiaceae bacterium]
MAKSQVPMVVPDELVDPIVFPADVIQRLAPVFEVSTTGMAHLLGISRHVVWRSIHRREALPAMYQGRAMGAIRLYALALDLCWYQTVNGRRETRRWLNDWLRTPRPGARKRRLIELLSTEEGQKELLALVVRISTDVYTSEQADSS